MDGRGRQLVGAATMRRGAHMGISRRIKARAGGLARALTAAAATMTDEVQLAASLRGRTAELERLNAVLQEQEADHAQLLKATINAQEAERRRVARQLHDDLAQSLTGLIMGLDAVEPLLAEGATDLHQQLGRTRAIVSLALDQTRRLILDLRPTMLDDLGLVSAIRWYADTHLTASGAVVVFSAEGPPRRLPPEIETALFRIGQEAINNVVRHAAARHVAIALTLAPEEAVLRVEDDGVGFDPAAAAAVEPSGAGLGLLGMRERAAIVGGVLTIDSRPGQGTRVEVHVPTGRP